MAPWIILDAKAAWLGGFFILRYEKFYFTLGRMTGIYMKRKFDIWIDRLFLIVLLIMLVLPISHINHSDKSTTEKRMLATYPELFINKDDKVSVNDKFGIEYDKWFSDRFFGRDVLIKIYGGYTVNESNEKVLVTDDNWLFYKQQHSLRNFSNKDRLTEQELIQLKTYLSSINDWCKKHNKKFVFVIAPDKNKIYGEHIHTIIKEKPDSESRAMQVVNYLNPDILTVYPYDALIKNKDMGLLYFKNDTHWNTLGAYIGYQEIMRALKLKPVKYNKFKQTTYPRGDLTAMAPSIGPDNKTIYKLPDIQDVFDGDCRYDDTADTHCTNKHYAVNKSVFTLRDSFSIALGPYYANTFKSVDFRWRNNITKQDFEYIKNNADIVILEVVERNVHALAHTDFTED